MKRSLQFTGVALVAVLLTTSCYNTVEQQLQYGDYDTALRQSLERINKSRKRDEYISIALKAYNKVMEDEKYRIGQLRSQNSDGRNWGKIYYLYKQMENRQRTIYPYLPLTYLDGSTVQLDLLDFGPVMEESRLQAAEYHYNRSLSYLQEGSRLSARIAYAELGNIDQYAYNYRDAAALKNQAIEQGTNKVLISFRTASDVHLPEAFFNEISYHDYEGLLGNWSRLYRQSPDPSEIDYTITLTVEALNISPQHLRELHYTEQIEVEDGHQPLVDHEGNYVTDSTGNIIQIPRYKTLTCHVSEWIQDRTASVVTGFEIYDMHIQRTVVRQNLEDHAVFENNYALANGHLQILPQEILRKLERGPVPFPNDLEMVLLTTNGLKHQIGRAIQRNQFVLDDA